MSVTRFDHVGVLVDNLDDAGRFLTEALGLELDRQGDQPELGLRTAFYTFGPVQIELIERISDSSRMPPLDGAAARIDHIAVESDDLRATTEALAKLGVRMLDMGRGEEPLPLGGNLNHWTDPQSSDGVKYQVIEKGAG